MQVTEHSTKLKLFMDVLDGTKAAVSHCSIVYFNKLPFHLLLFAIFFIFLSLSVDDTNICALSSSWIYDGHFTAYPPQTVEEVCVFYLFIVYRFPDCELCTLDMLSTLSCSLCVSSVVAAAPDILSPLSLILESVLQADQQMMERTKAKIFSALISVLQIQEVNGKSLCFFSCA